MSEVVQIAMLCSIMFTFSLGPGPFTLVVINEMLPLQLRGKVRRRCQHAGRSTGEGGEVGLLHAGPLHRWGRQSFFKKNY